MAKHKPKSGYVVVEIGWEYNDEEYYRPECGGGTPLKFFTEKTVADAVCAKMNKDAHKLTNYQYNEATEEYDSEVELPKYEVVEVEVE